MSARGTTASGSFLAGGRRLLRDRAKRLSLGAQEPGTARFRFWREQRAQLSSSLVGILALLAGVTGLAAVMDIATGTPSLAQTLSQGITSAGLGVSSALAFTFRRNLRGLLTVAVVATLLATIGWSIVVHASGGVTGRYGGFAVPMTFAVLMVSLPLTPPLPLPLTLVALVASALSAPGCPPLAYVLCIAGGGGGLVFARSRARRAIRAWHRMERLRGILARMQRNQERLVVVEKLEALRVLVGGMAHELNNALAVSLASTQHVVRVALADPAAAVKSARRAEGGLSRIRATIDRLKSFALASEGVLEAADVAAMLDFAVESAIGRSASAVMVDRDYRDDVGAVECHVAALAEALFQVVKNAVEAMPEGGTVRVSVRREGSEILLAVADEGQGIPADRLPRVFDPFFAREGVETFTGRVLPPLPGKSGLGLSTVYGIVTAMGGKVGIESEVGRGTEVTIRLPARRSG